MTSQTYQTLRPFVLQHTWNRTQDELCENGRDPSVYERNLLPRLIELDRVLGNSPHRHTVPLELDVHLHDAEEVEEQTEALPQWRQTLQSIFRKPATVMELESEYHKDENSNYHSWVWNRTHFAVRYTTSGLELLGTIVHEGEHADQSDIALHTSDEQKLILLNRLLYTPPERDKTAYQVNYIEMRARLCEAKLCLELFPHLQNDPQWNMQERAYFLSYCESVSKQLLRHVDTHSIDDINDWLVKSLRHNAVDCPYLHDVFNGDTPQQRNRNAAKFLDTAGRALHQALFNEMCNALSDLVKIKTRLNNELSPANYEKTKQQDYRRDVIRICQENKIPLVSSEYVTPFPQNMQNVDNPMVSLQDIIQIAKLNYNPALVITSEGLAIVYDTHPCQRPYGPKITIPEEKQTQPETAVHDARHVDVLEIDEWDNFDEP